MPNHLSIVDFGSPSLLNIRFMISNDVRGMVILLYSLRGFTSLIVKLFTGDLVIQMLVRSCFNSNIL